MRTRARFLGEQLNPLLTLLPLGMLGAAVLFDFGGLLGHFRFFGHVALWDMAAGLLAGLVAVVALLVDLILAPTGSRARRVLGVETSAVGSMVLLFLMVWAERADDRAAGNAGLFVIEVFALVVGAIGAWLGRTFVVGLDTVEVHTQAGPHPAGPHPAGPWFAGQVTGGHRFVTDPLTSVKSLGPR